MQSFPRRRATLAVGALTAFSAACSLFALAVAPATALLPSAPPYGWVPVVVAYALVERLVATVKHGSESHTFSPGELVLVLGILFLAPRTLLLAQAAGFAIALVARGQRGLRLGFNLAQMGVATAAAIAVSRVLAGPDAAAGTGLWVAVLTGVVANVLVNVGLVTAALAAVQGLAAVEPLPMLSMALLNGLVMGASALVASAAAAVSPSAAALGVIPLIGGFLAFQGYVRERSARAGVTFLYETTKTLHRSTQLEPALAELLARACAMFRSERGEVAIRRPAATGWLRVRVGPPDWARAVDSSSGAPPAWLPPVEGAVQIGRGHQRGEAIELLDQLGVRNAVVAALPGDDDVAGIIAVGGREDGFSDYDDEDLRLFDLLANQVAIGLENGRLEQSLAALARLEREVRHQATHDALTGLANRVLLRSHVEDEATDVAAVLLIDLDDFKAVNDTLGHEAGDQVLVQVADRLRAVTRDHDLIARLGGDEFAIAVSGQPGREAVLEFARRLTSVLEAPLLVAGVELHVRGSVGVAFPQGSHLCLDEALRGADVALYEAKRQGKSRSVVFEPGMDAAARERLDLRSAFRRGLHDGELSLAYQPVVDLVTGDAVGVEALVRWNHPTRGPLVPAQFVPAVEQAGLIAPLGAWVLDRALEDLARIDVASWEQGAPALRLHLNVAARQLHDPEFPGRVRDSLRLAGVDPSRLVLELTEVGLVEDLDLALARMAELRATGVELAMDDFGTGVSSLTSLHRLPIGMLKVDRTFVARIGGLPPDRAIATALLNVARALDLEPVAEGVETEEQRVTLIELGCRLGQGYRFARPMPLDELVCVRLRSAAR